MPFTMPFCAVIGFECGCLVETRDKVNWTITHCSTHSARPFGKISELVEPATGEQPNEDVNGG